MGSSLHDIQPSIEEIYEAQRAMKGIVLRTPLVPLNIDWPHGKVKKKSLFLSSSYLNIHLYWRSSKTRLKIHSS